MQLVKKMRVLLPVLALLCALAACGAPATSIDETVQDIQPGDPSVIQAPGSPQPELPNRLEERNI